MSAYVVVLLRVRRQPLERMGQVGASMTLPHVQVNLATSPLLATNGHAALDSME